MTWWFSTRFQILLHCILVALRFLHLFTQAHSQLKWNLLSSTLDLSWHFSESPVKGRKLWMIRVSILRQHVVRLRLSLPPTLSSISHFLPVYRCYCFCLSGPVLVSSVRQSEEEIVKSPHNQIKDLLFIGLIIHPDSPWIFSWPHCFCHLRQCSPSSWIQTRTRTTTKRYDIGAQLNS